MFPSEIVILMAIAGTRDHGRTLQTRPMDVTGEYIGYLYNSLVKRGYLVGNSAKGYRLTSKGRDSLLKFLHDNRTRVKDTIETLQQLQIETSVEIDKLEKEVIEVS
jgi:predicted transcriptional regulator